MPNAALKRLAQLVNKEARSWRVRSKRLFGCGDNN